MPEQFRRFLAPEMERPPMQFDQPQLEWMPWEQDNDVGNMGTIVDQLKKRQTQGAAGGAMGTTMGGMKLPGAGGAKGSL